jgi:F-type H+-transporting ATPase subunit b
MRRTLLAAMVGAAIAFAAPAALAQHAQPESSARHEPTANAGEEASEPGAINWLEGPFLGNAQPPFIAILVNFAVLLGVYYYFGRKPIAEALRLRRVTVAKEIEDARRMQREAEARAKTYQAKLASLEEELATARAALVEAGKGERERIVKEAEERAARMARDAEHLLEQEIKQIRQDLWRETVEHASRAAEELLKKRVTAADQERIAEDYLADLPVPKGASLKPPPAPGAAE